jgi:putative ATPase
LLKPEGRLVLAETVPRHTQRLHQLVDLSRLESDLVERVIAAEETIYTNPDDPMVNWDASDLASILTDAGFSNIEIVEETLTSQLRLDPAQIERWFSQNDQTDRPTFAQHLLNNSVVPAELEQLKDVFESQLLGQVVTWQSKVVYVVAHQ